MQRTMSRAINMTMMMMIMMLMLVVVVVMVMVMVVVTVMVMVRRSWIVTTGCYRRCFGLAAIKNDVLNAGNYDDLDFYILKLVFFIFYF